MSDSTPCLLCAFAVAICTACTSAAPVEKVVPDTLAQIKQLIGTAACTSTADCRTAAIGARACGGPEFYLPWSTTVTDGVALKRLTERYATQRRAAIKASGEQSTCSIPPDPGAICVAGQCRLGTAGPDPA